MENIYFLTFYTEGDPDGGYPLTKSANDIKEKLSPYFTDIFMFNKRELKELPGSEQICNSFEEELQMNPNANHIGYFDFKPFLIDHILKKIPEGSILIYHDGNFEKNDQYWQSDWPNIKEMSKKLMGDNNSDVFVQVEREGVYVKEYVKTYTIDKLIDDPIENDIVKNSPLINAARLILRNTEFSRNFIKDYLNLCMDKTLLARTPNPSPDKDFKWNCGDQDVLNLLVYRYILDKKFHPEFPMYSFLYRILRYENRPFMWEKYKRDHWTGISRIHNSRMVEYMGRK